MSENLNTFFTETTDKYYNRLVRIYNNRINKANDRDYTHNEFTKYCEALLNIRYIASERETIITALEHEYKIGKEFSQAIKIMRKELHKKVNDNSIDFIEVTKENRNPVFEKETSTSKQETYFIDQYSDLELVRMFSEYKAYEKFSEFLKSEKLTLNSVNEPIEIFPSVEKLKEFTTARQVLAVHYLLKYSNVKNIDKTEIARFIQFLTGKNYDNIYKKLQNPFKINDKSLKEDLRFVRGYFERLEMTEVVKMINNELNVN